MTGLLVSTTFVSFIAFMAVFPYVCLQGASRRLYLILDVSTYAALSAFVIAAPILGIQANHDLGLAFLIVIKLTIFCVFCAVHHENVNWSATRAGIFAGAIYLLLVPHVLRFPVDGDEPFYVLIAESIVEDHDLDLANQYSHLADSHVGRVDLGPQQGDPTGPNGELYSRHEPFLSLLLIPGLLLAGLPGAVATIALFGGLLIRSVHRLLDESGVPQRVQLIVFPLIAFGPPVLFYSTRIWPEVPAAFLFTELLRGALQLERESESRRSVWTRLVIAALGIGLLKLRFVIIAASILALVVLREVRRGRGRWMAGAAVLVIAVPFLALLSAQGSPTSVHGLGELVPQRPMSYVTGILGLLADGAEGLLFQAPVCFLALLALTRWRTLGGALRLGMISALPYIVLLVPRAEWHGGWSPPLRYVVVFTPLFALGIAEVCGKLRGWRSLLTVAAVGSAAIVAHGIAYPWRLFHIADGQNYAGEWLSRSLRSDFSRMFPSYIRPNEAAIIMGVAIVLGFAILGLASRRFWDATSESSHRSGGAVLTMACLGLLISIWFRVGLMPGQIVEFEDAHVEHTGGVLFPEQWAPMRFLHRGGWTLRTGDAMTFAYAGGTSVLHYVSEEPVVLDIDGKSLTLRNSHGDWYTERIDLARGRGRLSLRSIRGTVTLEKIERIERE